MNLKLEIEFSKADILHEVDVLKKQIDDMRPLPADVEGKVMQKLRLDWNYNSNAIEGNKLSYGETVAFLMEGITAKGKPLKDHLDIRGHNEAILFLTALVKDSRPISESDIRGLHEMVLVEPYDVKAQTDEGLPTTKRITLGEYKKLPNHVKTATGELHYYTNPEETPAKMRELMEWYNEAINSTDIHPLVTAALFHHKFVAIHPFDDGNGRLSRILMNLILMQQGFPPVIVKMDDRQNYYSLLSRADVGDSWPFIEYIAERLQSSIQLYLKAAKGEDIDEDDDIDKEIALFKLELNNKTGVKEKRSKENVTSFILNELIILLSKISIKANQYEEFFFGMTKEVYLNYKVDDKTDTHKIVIDVDDFNPITEYVKTANKLYDSLDFKVSMGEFRNSQNSFDISIYLDIKFDNYEYKVYDSDFNLILAKFYHEKLTLQDQKQLLQKFMANIKNHIEDKLKQSKSR